MELIKAACTVGIFTLLSRFSGYCREITIAYCLGAGVYADAFFVALKLANTLRRVFAEGAFAASFLPRFSKILVRDGKEKANGTLANVFTVMLGIIGVFSLIMLVFFPEVLSVLVSGFDESSYKFALTVKLGRICFPYLLLVSITSLFAGVLNTVDRFAWASGVHCILSVFIICGIIASYWLGSSHEQIVFVASICVVLAGILQVAILYINVMQHGFRVWISGSCLSPEVKDILKHMLPGIFAAGIWQFNLVIDMTVCSYFPSGTITCINLADRLNQFPLGTLGVALGTALLPILSKAIAVEDFKAVNREMHKGLLFSMFMTLYATVLLAAISVPCVATAFQRGAFGGEQVIITAAAVEGFAIGLPFYVLAKVFSTLFFAAGDTKRPVFIGVASVLVNIVCLIVLPPFLKYFGLALCSAIAAMVNAVLLICIAMRRFSLQFSTEFYCKFLCQCIAAVITFFILKLQAYYIWDNSYGTSHIKWIVVAYLFVSGALIFFAITTVGLLFTKQKQWKLWRKDAW